MIAIGVTVACVGAAIRVARRLTPVMMLLVTLPLASAAQSSVRAAAKPSLEQSARRIVASVAYPTFITTDSTGRPQARTVQPQPPDSAWTVWFATNPRTRKVREIARDPRVVLHYFDQATLSYVSLIGRARVARDRATKDAHWSTSWNAFYPDRDTSVVLIAVGGSRIGVRLPRRCAVAVHTERVR